MKAKTKAKAKKSTPAKSKMKKIKKASAAQLKKLKGGAVYSTVKNVPTGYSGWGAAYHTPVGPSRPSGGGGSSSGANRERAGK